MLSLSGDKTTILQGANYMVNLSGQTHLTDIFFQDEIRVLYFNVIHFHE